MTKIEELEKEYDEITIQMAKCSVDEMMSLNEKRKKISLKINRESNFKKNNKQLLNNYYILK